MLRKPLFHKYAERVLAIVGERDSLPETHLYVQTESCMALHAGLQPQDRNVFAPRLRFECCEYGLGNTVAFGLSLRPRNHTIQRDDVTYIVFCFAEPSHAERFRERFGGEPFNLKDGCRGSTWLTRPD